MKSQGKRTVGRFMGCPTFSSKQSLVHLDLNPHSLYVLQQLAAHI